METLDEFIEKIKKSPSVYLGQRSIFHLEVFLDGYRYARREFQIPPAEKDRELKEFLKWIRTKYTVAQDRSWSRVILFYSEDERDALDSFFELYEQFKNRNILLPNNENHS